MTEKNKLILPTLHMNGTSHRMLATGYGEAVDALRRAQEAIGQIEFNARDYYPQGGEAWTQAVREMDKRRQRIAEVIMEFEEVELHLDRLHRT